jgi:hypothetical protein
MWGRMRGKIIDIKKAPVFNRGFSNLAEAVRFELTEDSHPRRFSRQYALEHKAMIFFLNKMNKLCILTHMEAWQSGLMHRS